MTGMNKLWILYIKSQQLKKKLSYGKNIVITTFKNYFTGLGVLKTAQLFPYSLPRRDLVMRNSRFASLQVKGSE